MTTFIGLFDDQAAARRAIAMLQDSQYDLEDLSLITRASEREVAVSSADDVSASQGATVGAVWGGIVGLASLMIPGVGPVIAGGALAAGLTSALAGAVAGAVVGGITAALIEFGGIPEEEAHRYEELVHAGKTLVAVKASPEDARHIRRILTKGGAEAVQDDQTAASAALNAPVQVAAYDERGERVDLAGD